MAGPEINPNQEEEEQLGVQVEILDFRKIPSQDPRRLGKYDALILVRVGGVNIYSWRVPYEEVDTEEKLIKKIKELLKEELKFVGKRFVI